MNKYRVTFAYVYQLNDTDWHTMSVTVKARNKERAIEIVKSHWRYSKWHHVDVLELKDGETDEK